jgi:hypothetical protein
MGSDGADEKILKDFTDRNTTTEMARPWIPFMLKEADFKEVSFVTSHRVLLSDDRPDRFKGDDMKRSRGSH